MVGMSGAAGAARWLNRPATMGSRFTDYHRLQLVGPTNVRLIID